jgi:periplasmic protein TonB
MRARKPAAPPTIAAAELQPFAVALRSTDDKPTPAPVAPPPEVPSVPAQPAVRSAGTPRSPSVLSQVEPVYPPAARRDRIHGVVVVEVQLDRVGRIARLHIRKSIPLLDAAALAALRQWRFGPARNEYGTAIAATVVVPVRFVLR